MLNRLANLGKNWKAYQCAVCGTIVKIDENERKTGREIVFCNDCAAYVKYLMYPKDDITDRNYKMPGMKTIAQMGGVSGAHRGEAVNNNLVIRCTVVHSDGTETTWDYHAYTGKVENQRRGEPKVPGLHTKEWTGKRGDVGKILSNDDDPNSEIHLHNHPDGTTISEYERDPKTGKMVPKGRYNFNTGKDEMPKK